MGVSCLLPWTGPLTRCSLEVPATMAQVQKAKGQGRLRAAVHRRVQSRGPGPTGRTSPTEQLSSCKRNVSMKIKRKVTYCILMYRESIFLEDILGGRFWLFSYELLQRITKFYE